MYEERRNVRWTMGRACALINADRGQEAVGLMNHYSEREGGVSINPPSLEVMRWMERGGTSWDEGVGFEEQEGEEEGEVEVVGELRWEEKRN